MTHALSSPIAGSTRAPAAHPPRRTGTPWLNAAVGVVLSLATLPAAAFIPVQTYYVPLPEDELLSPSGT
jgi:hypothetical protein